MFPNIPSTTKQTAATTTKTSNSPEQLCQITNDFIEGDKEDFKGTHSFEYNYENDQQTEVDYDEPSVFCYNSDSSFDEFPDSLSDDEHNDDNSTNTLNEATSKFRQNASSTTLRQHGTNFVFFFLVLDNIPKLI